MTNLKIIEAAVIASNPEIEGKHFFAIGYNFCDFCGVARIVRDRKASNRVVDEGSGGSSQEVEQTDYNNEGGPCPEHQNRPIRLADVLLAIGKEKKVYVSSAGGIGMFKEGFLDTIVHWQVPWNLRKDNLAKQSEETLAFLAELLK